MTNNIFDADDAFVPIYGTSTSTYPMIGRARQAKPEAPHLPYSGEHRQREAQEEIEAMKKAEDEEQTEADSKTSAPAPKPPKRLLYVICTDGTQFRLLVDAGDKITFGPAIPGPRNGGGYSVNEYALRIYRGNEKTGLKAVYPGVREFAESDIVKLPW